MASKVVFEFSKTATTNIEEAISYISKTLCNPRAAQSLWDEIIKKIDIIISFPESYQIVDNKFSNSQSIRKVPVKSYNLYYDYDSSNGIVTLICFINSHQDSNTILESAILNSI